MTVLILELGVVRHLSALLSCWYRNCGAMLYASRVNVRFVGILLLHVEEKL
jgi:hypothetical protein